MIKIAHDHDCDDIALSPKVAAAIIAPRAPRTRECNG
jgi:hypothetical protein